MFSNVKSNTVILAVAATLAMIVSTPSFAGESNMVLPATAPGGMGFGPMTVSLFDVARATKPIPGDEATTPQSPSPVMPVAAPPAETYVAKAVEPTAVRPALNVIVASKDGYR